MSENNPSLPPVCNDNTTFFNQRGVLATDFIAALRQLADRRGNRRISLKHQFVTGVEYQGKLRTFSLTCRKVDPMRAEEIISALQQMIYDYDYGNRTVTVEGYNPTSIRYARSGLRFDVHVKSLHDE